ncbi:hypothetical protein N657DRAFT_196018 [Parathielavia appendiculata]|uniref:Uncharacterized protein n=1 Tax=Parathielavia appendiculata TaxID=2587402 RepID=A0AAN6U6Q3_9PEZI|nr:hypothetical protein N657DRAFT_196018 [Parathielavia appendiculata]
MLCGGTLDTTQADRRQLRFAAPPIHDIPPLFVTLVLLQHWTCLEDWLDAALYCIKTGSKPETTSHNPLKKTMMHECNFHMPLQMHIHRIYLCIARLANEVSAGPKDEKAFKPYGLRSPKEFAPHTPRHHSNKSKKPQEPQQESHCLDLGQLSRDLTSSLQP